MLKKPLTWFGFTLLCAGLIGCSNEPEANVPTAEETEEKTNEEGKFDPAVPITTVRTINTNDVKFKDGEDINNNVHTEWAREELGVDFEYLWTVNEDDAYDNRIRLSLSSGEEIPDVFQVSDSNLINDLIKSGEVMPIDEAIEQHASPRLKEIFEEYSEAFYRGTVDGERYGLPRFSGGNGSDPLLWIRQDWLDNVGLEIPETMDELDEVLEAFTTEDPDGDGEDNTFGLSMASANGLNTWQADGSWVFGAYGDYVPGNWSESEDGSLKYGSVQPNIKDGLTKLNEWYENGYLDSEVTILDETQAAEGFVAGRSGVIAVPPWGYNFPANDTMENNEGAEVVPIPLPEGPDGDIGRRGEQLLTGVFLFNKDFEHMDAFFKYWDETYGALLGDSEYFEDGLFEGYDYVMEEGEPVYGDDNVPGGVIDPGRYFLTGAIPTYPYQEYEKASEFYNEEREPENGYERLLQARGENYLEAADILNQQNEHRVENRFDGPPTDTMEKRWDQLETRELEVVAKIINGTLPVDAFDEFVEEWNEGGGEAITEEVNEWYSGVQEAE
ncbi:extracellular solute-binding protein [Alteribacillus sp. HJP-4]|uniref:extracellular solute-binding protein n=1 Tax=Alteribacillus sp. HJP-4 TaxID=2775394 RepID=UPI0035CD3C97